MSRIRVYEKYEPNRFVAEFESEERAKKYFNSEYYTYENFGE